MARGSIGAARRVARVGRGRRGTRPTGRGRGRSGLGRPAPMPFDSTAERESGELGNEAADERAYLAARYAAAQHELGFGVGASDPYSKAAENLRGYAADRRGTLNGAGNQLYSGSTANALSEGRGRYDRNRDAIGDAATRAQNAYTSGIAQTGRQEALGNARIASGAIERAAKTEPAPLAVGRGVGRGRGRRPTPGTAPRANGVRRRGRR